MKDVEEMVIDSIHILFILEQDGVAEGDGRLQDAGFVEAFGSAEVVFGDVGDALGEHW